ncbi:MAG: VIT1/CCC1 transporter family protein [Chloroflexi bacterium]|nr:VIT1/CCC1 transporter family protein [Chloroflexota bacterium]MCL5273842.1 VIT1/CCC1 transporter family protein [Chloroflexota bacterium]
MEAKEARRYLGFLDDELNAVVLYNALAQHEQNPKLSEVYRRMATVEQHHADEWKTRLESMRVRMPLFRERFRTRLLKWLMKRAGVAFVLPSITAMESKGVNSYAGVPNAGRMGADEQTHGRMLRSISQTVRGGLEGGFLAQVEGRHRGTGGNALRAAVLGANDGLTSVLSLVMGVAGAGLPTHSILITGLAGLLAGAISMALGEWLSVQSSRELYTKQIAIEQAEIASSPQEEIEELSLIYQARGIEDSKARVLATEIMSNKETALDTLSREELGIDPGELGGSAWEAAITSFVLFALGAIIPVSPFIFLTGSTAVIVSIIFAVFGLFTIGSATTLFTGRTVLFSGLRMVLFGLAAAAVTYTIGHLLGVNAAG